jgi:predicted nucleic acid-binding Zn ribbon protein
MISSFCNFCSKPVNGRSDKRFCSDHCRTAFHNNVKKEDFRNAYMCMINGLIKKNRNILKSFLEENRTDFNSTDLLIRGFNFTFFTHEKISNSGNVYRFCYDYGYLLSNEGDVYVIKNSSYS